MLMAIHKLPISCFKVFQKPKLKLMYKTQIWKLTKWIQNSFSAKAKKTLKVSKTLLSILELVINLLQNKFINNSNIERTVLFKIWIKSLTKKWDIPSRKTKPFYW